MGVLWVLAAAAAVLVPALVHGSSFGSFDLLSRFGLTQQPGVAVHNGQATDQITEMIPWTSLAWTQVHHGQLPLWNPYSALGLPLAFNWQSATFSIPALLGYLAPLRLAYTVQVFASLFIAGTGVYVLGRVLRLGVLGCVTAATIYELSGPLMGFLGWPIAGVMSWAGWIFAAAVIVVRGRHRLRAVSFFGVVLACAFYAGQPGTLALLVLATAVFLVVLLARTAQDSRQHEGVIRPLADLAVASVIGVALAAPLLLPGAQLLSESVFRHVQRTNQALPAQDVVYLLLQGFNGVPLSHVQFFGVGTTAYVGVIGLVLAVMGLGRRWRQPEVVAFGVVAVLMMALAFFPPVVALANSLPYRARLGVAVVLLAFSIAFLAGVGMDELVRYAGERIVRNWCAAGFGAATFVLLELWFFGRGTLHKASAHLRDQSFIWPAIEIVVGLAVIGLLIAAERHLASRPAVRGHRKMHTRRVGRDSAPSLRDSLPHRCGSTPVPVELDVLRTDTGGDRPSRRGGILGRRLRDPLVPDTPHDRNRPGGKCRVRNPRVRSVRPDRTTGALQFLAGGNGPEGEYGCPGVGVLPCGDDGHGRSRGCMAWRSFSSLMGSQGRPGVSSTK